MVDFELDVNMMLEMSFSALCLDFGNSKYENVIMRYYHATIPILDKTRLKPLCLFYVDSRKVEFIKRLIAYNSDIYMVFCSLNYIHIKTLRSWITLPDHVIFNAIVCDKKSVENELLQFYKPDLYKKVGRLDLIVSCILNPAVESHLISVDPELYVKISLDLDYIKPKCQPVS